MKILSAICILICSFFAFLFVQNSLKSTEENKSVKKTKTMKKIVRTDEEWKKILSPEQYRILREAGTERPNGEIYLEFKKQGAGTTIVQVVMQNYFLPRKSLIPVADGHLFMILPRLKI